jgi:hypothetical protein
VLKAGYSQVFCCLIHPLWASQIRNQMLLLTDLGFLIDRIGRRPLFLSMISLMAAVMVVQTGLIYNVQNKTSIAKSCGAGAAAMLFIFQGAFTIGSC